MPCVYCMWPYVSIVLRSNKRALPSGKAQIPVNHARELSLNASLCQITKTVSLVPNTTVKVLKV